MLWRCSEIIPVSHSVQCLTSLISLASTKATSAGTQLTALQAPFYKSLTYSFSLPVSTYFSIIKCPLPTFRMIAASIFIRSSPSCCISPRLHKSSSFVYSWSLVVIEILTISVLFPLHFRQGNGRQGGFKRINPSLQVPKSPAPTKVSNQYWGDS